MAGLLVYGYDSFVWLGESRDEVSTRKAAGDGRAKVAEPGVPGPVALRGGVDDPVVPFEGSWRLIRASIEVCWSGSLLVLCERARPSAPTAAAVGVEASPSLAAAAPPGTSV
jgi:hypothetical protein